MAPDQQRQFPGPSRSGLGGDSHAHHPDAVDPFGAAPPMTPNQQWHFQDPSHSDPGNIGPMHHPGAVDTFGAAPDQQWQSQGPSRRGPGNNGSVHHQAAVAPAHNYGLPATITPSSAIGIPYPPERYLDGPASLQPSGRQLGMGETTQMNEILNLSSQLPASYPYAHILYEFEPVPSYSETAGPHEQFSAAVVGSPPLTAQGVPGSAPIVGPGPPIAHPDGPVSISDTESTQQTPFFNPYAPSSATPASIYTGESDGQWRGTGLSNNFVPAPNPEPPFQQYWVPQQSHSTNPPLPPYPPGYVELQGFGSGPAAGGVDWGGAAPFAQPMLPMRHDFPRGESGSSEVYNNSDSQTRHGTRPKRVFKCPRCSLSYRDKNNWEYHLWMEHNEYALEIGIPNPLGECPSPGCGYIGRKRFNLPRHMESKHGD